MSEKFDKSFYRALPSGLDDRNDSPIDFIYEDNDNIPSEIVDIYLDGVESGICYTCMDGTEGFVEADFQSGAKPIMDYIEKIEVEKSILVQKYHTQKLISKGQHQELLRLEAKCENLEKELKELKK